MNSPLTPTASPAVASSATTGPVILAPWVVRHRAATILVCVAVILRLALYLVGPAHDIQRAHYPDSPRYITLGVNLAEKGVFSHPLDAGGVVLKPLAELRQERGELEPADRFGLQPEILRTPGYPFLIALMHVLRLPLDLVLVIQALLGGLNVLLVYLIARRLFGPPRIAIAAAAILALSPGDIVAANSLLTETLFASLMLGGILLVVVGGPRSPGRGALAGVALGLSVLVRPVGLLLGPAIGLWMLVTQRNVRGWMTAGVLTVASLVPPALWAWRNDTIGFGFHVCNAGTFNNYFKNVAYMRLHRTGLDFERDWPALVPVMFAELRQELREDETVFDGMSRLAWAELRADPMAYAAIAADSAIKLFTDHHVGGLYAKLGWDYQPSGLRDSVLSGRGLAVAGASNASTLVLALAWSAMNALLAVLMLVGFWRMFRRGHGRALLLLGGVILYFTLITQVHGAERLRVPFMGLQAIAVAAMLLPRLALPVAARIAATSSPDKPARRLFRARRSTADPAPRPTLTDLA